MNKSFRHGQILKLIRSRKIFTQEDLARELRDVFSIPATQVTLSRDIRELGLVKTPDGYRQMEAVSSGPDLATAAGDFLLDIRVAENLIVLKTSPAHASSLAVALDEADWPEIVGTIAGDDTVLVIAPDAATAEGVREKLMEFVRGE